MSLRYRLLVAIPENDPISFPLSEDTIKVGRNEANDIQILVKEISTAHCELKATDSGYQIIDCGSTNGTKVNDRPVREPVELNSRDVILLGETVPTYFIAAEEGADLDLKSEIAEIEKARSMPKEPTAKNPTVPGGVKKVGLPGKQPLEAVPVAVTPPSEGDNTDAAAQAPPRPATKLGMSPVKPAPPSVPPTVIKIPFASPPGKKLAGPEPSDASPASSPASPPSPSTKLPSPATPLASPPSPSTKLPSPASPPPPSEKFPSPASPPEPPTEAPPIPKAPPMSPPRSAPGGIALMPTTPPPPPKKLPDMAPKPDNPDKEE